MAFSTKNFNNWLSRLWLSRRGIDKLDKKMARLRAKRDDVKKQIGKAEREGKISTNEVNQWLGEVEALERQVTDIQRVLRNMRGTSSQTQQEGDQVRIGESSNCWSINRKVTKKLGEANDLMRRADALVPIATVGPWEPTHRPPVGIKSNVKDIVGYIDGGVGNIIGIHGMGGVGKTTMLKSIQQHYLLTHIIFDHVIWVVASKDYQLKRLQMDIAKSLGLNTLQENDDEQTCGYKLFRYLKNKKCLLFLDDIWKHVDLKLLGLAHSATERGQQQQQQPRKVVVFTTHSEPVCVQMKAEKKIKVKCLEPEEAWQLFEQNSDKKFLSSYGAINFVAHQLAKECAGLPLALKTVARAMLGKKSLEAWTMALREIRDKHDWTTIGVSEDSLVYKAFKLSYDSLENDSIRECLLCCALWPKDYEMDKFEDLIPCWIGCGIICDFNAIHEAFYEGCSHLDDLMAASLLEHFNRNSVKMHKVIRAMALLVVSGVEGNKRKWIVKAGIELSHLPRQKEWQDAQRASFMRNEISSLEEYYGASTFPKLSMLFLQYNSYSLVSQSLFPSMPCLTYLDLSKCGILELPKEIRSLTVLEYLNLLGNPIRKLPAELGCLGKLKYLLLRDTGLKRGLNGTISNLSMLKWLDIKGISGVSEWWWDELKYFQGRHLLSVAIEIGATAVDIVRLTMLPNVSMWDLTINGYNISDLPDLNLGTSKWSYNISDNLESLIIQSVRVDIIMLSSGVGHKPSFRRLKKLVFCSLLKLEEISLNGVELYCLRELNIWNCPKLKDVSWVLLLPCLAVLVIKFCPGMKELIRDVGNSGSVFGIQSLTLWCMSNLNYIANQPFHFPCLECIQVFNCPKLKKFPFEAEILKSKLIEIKCEEAWWHNLEWDEESFRVGRRKL